MKSLFFYFFSLIFAAVIVVGVLFVVLDDTSGVRIVKTTNPVIKSDKPVIEESRTTLVANEKESEDLHVAVVDPIPDIPESSSDDKEDDEEDDESVDSCLSNYDLSSDTVIFYYSIDSHSENMKPIVEEVEKDYSFFWNSELWDKDFNSCFGFSGTLPAFACAGSRDIELGELSYGELVSFAEGCKT